MPKKACCEHPQLQEIIDVLTHLGLEFAVEDKIYSRDFSQRGRLRVQLKDPITKELVNEKYPTRAQRRSFFSRHPKPDPSPPVAPQEKP